MYSKKKHIDHFKADLHTVSVLPIVDLLERLQTLAGIDLMFLVSETSSDHAVFLIAPRYQHPLFEVEVRGQLRRWEGTYTRLDASSDIMIRGEWLETFSDMAVLLVVILFFSFLLYTITSMLRVPFGFEGVLMGALAAWFVVRNLPVLNIFGEIRFRALKRVDIIMQQIADAITADSDSTLFEYDGSEDALARLLMKFKE